VTNFETRQGPVPDAERMKRYRERKRRAQYHGDASVTSRNTETDTDTETESDTEPESDSALSSFVSESVCEFENSIGMVANQRQSEELTAFLTELHERGHPEWWQMAIDVACDANARKWSYMRAVLQNWIDAGSPNLGGNGSRASPQEDDYDMEAALAKAKRYGLG